MADIETPSKPVFLTAIILVVALIGSWWLFLGRSGYGQFVFAVCVVFTLIAAGITAICANHALRDKAGAQPFGGSRSRFATWTGNVPKKEAVVQILLIPASLTAGFIALAVVDVIVRG